MVLSLRSYLKKTRKRFGMVKTVCRCGTSSITSLWMCSRLRARLRRTSRELHCSLSSTGWAHPSALTGEGDKEGVFAPVAINPGGTVSKYAAVKIFVEGLHHLIPQAPILVLELGFPLDREVAARVVDDLVEHGGFRSSSPVVLKLLLYLLPRVAPEHTG